MRRQSGQALVEWGLSAFVLMLFAFGLLAVRQIVGEDMAVRSAATQAAAAAVLGSQIENLQVTIDTGSFQRGSTLTVTARVYEILASFPIISQVLGGRVEV